MDLRGSNGISNVKKNSVKYQGTNGKVIITGIANGTEIVLFSITGTKIGNTTAVGDEAIIETGLKLGDIIIVKIGVTCFKIVMR